MQPWTPASLVALLTIAACSADAQEPEVQERWRDRAERLETEGLAEPFRGIAIDGERRSDLYPIRSTGVDTGPITEAAQAFVDSLPADVRADTVFDIDDPEWRKWSNQHAYYRQGVSFEAMTPAQRTAALEMLGASLSAKGLRLTRDIMHLNETLSELSGDRADEYGEGRYWLTTFGAPSATEPWGWQLDGHHLNVNYFVLGDQVVMSPAFFGSEPTVAQSGKYAGTRVLEAEQNQGLAFLRTLTDAQRERAILEETKTANQLAADAFNDNLGLETSGLPARDLSGEQRQALLELIGLFVGNMAEGHSEVKMSEVEAQLDDTWFAWIGEDDDDAVFYYRILSPVVLIEFDHQRPIALRHLYPDEPNREHIHSVLRTPNGNDYGKDLLRQHLADHAH